MTEDRRPESRQRRSSSQGEDLEKVKPAGICAEDALTAARLAPQAGFEEKLRSVVEPVKEAVDAGDWPSSSTEILSRLSQDSRDVM